MANPATMPTAGTFGTAFNKKSGPLVVSVNATTPIIIYKGTLASTLANKSSNLVVDLSNALGVGYAKETGI